MLGVLTLWPLVDVVVVIFPVSELLVKIIDCFGLDDGGLLRRHSLGSVVVESDTSRSCSVVVDGQ